MTAPSDHVELRRLVANAKLVIEIGTLTGNSAEAILSGLPADGRLICIDTFQGTKGDFAYGYDRLELITGVLTRLAPFGDRLTLIVGESIATAALFGRGLADDEGMVFL